MSKKLQRTDTFIIPKEKECPKENTQVIELLQQVLTELRDLKKQVHLLHEDMLETLDTMDDSQDSEL